MVGRICTKFGDSNQNTSRLVHVKLCAMWCRFVLVRAKRLGGHFWGHTVYTNLGNFVMGSQLLQHAKVKTDR